MKKAMSFLATIFYLTSFCQSNPAQVGQAGKRYIFNYDIQLQECDAIGGSLGPTQIIPQGSTFKITHLTNSGYVIIIDKYTLPQLSPGAVATPFYTLQLDKRTRLNFIHNPAAGVRSIASENDNVKHFYLSNTDYASMVSELVSHGEWNYGTLIEPFKFRRHPAIFTSDISLGAVVGWQKGIRRSSWTGGIFCGLSLSKVTLDSLSTNGKVKTNTERPAFTPSINAILGFKGTFDITLGIGWDFINKTSDIEKNWVYNGKYWFGLGIGVKLFTPNSQKQTTAKQDQDKK